MPRFQYTIGVIDDDFSVRKALTRLLKTAGFEVVVFTEAEEFLAHPKRAAFACLAIDVCLPGMGGLDLLEQIRTEGDQPALMMTGYESENARQRAMAAGALGFLLKPFDNRALLSIVCSVPRINGTN